jgi:hypothetical protein
VLPAARLSEKCNPAHAEIADMFSSLVIKNAKIATRIFNDLL